MVERGIVGTGPVIAVGPESAFVEFDVAAWLEGIVATPQELGPVCNTPTGK